MKATINLNFKRIGKEKVDQSLLKENPKLFETTEKTLLILCQNIKKYFKDNHIKVKVKGQLKND